MLDNINARQFIPARTVNIKLSYLLIFILKRIVNLKLFYIFYPCIEGIFDFLGNNTDINFFGNCISAVIIIYSSDETNFTFIG